VKRLKRRQVDATGIDSGIKALELLEKEHFDVVILDVRMPGLDGIETLKRDEEKTTASGSDHAYRPCLGRIRSAGNAIRAFDYVMKPADINDLLEKIKAAHERKALHEEKVRETKMIETIRCRMNPDIPSMTCTLCGICFSQRVSNCPLLLQRNHWAVVALVLAVASFLAARRLTREIKKANEQKFHLDQQLIQSQKLAAIGTVFGIAHESQPARHHRAGNGMDETSHAGDGLQAPDAPDGAARFPARDRPPG